MGFLFYIWIIVTIVAIIVEIVTTDLTSFWFAIGSIAALISNIFLHDNHIEVQILIFVAVSAFSIILLRPIVKKKIDSPKIPTNADSMIGKVAIVTEGISLNAPGAIKIEGVEWTAVTDDLPFESGDLVEIVKITGNTLTVEKYEKEDE